MSNKFILRLNLAFCAAVLFNSALTEGFRHFPELEKRDHLAHPQTELPKSDRVPVAAAFGTKPAGADNEIWKMFDGVSVANDLGQCYVSGETAPVMTFQIPRSTIDKIRIVNRKDKDGGSYTMDAFLWYGCHQNDSYSVCSTLGSAEHYRSGHETYSFVDGKTTFADEIRVAVNPENLKRGDYQQLVICEIDFFGRILQPSQDGHFDNRSSYVNRMGVLGPERSNDAQTLFRDRYFKYYDYCYRTNETSPGALDRVEFYIHPAKVTEVRFKAESMPQQTVETYEIRVCKRRSDGTRLCRNCKMPYFDRGRYFYRTDCGDLEGDEVHFTIPVREGDTNIAIEICDVSIDGKNFRPDSPPQEHVNGQYQFPISYKIPVVAVYGTKGVNATNKLTNMLDGVKEARELDLCYVSDQQSAPTVTFEIARSIIDTIRIVQRHDSDSNYRGNYLHDFLWYGCTWENSRSTRKCTKMGSTDVDTIRDQYSYVDGRGLTADEIQVAVAPTLLAEEKYQQLYLCEVEILGQILGTPDQIPSDTSGHQSKNGIGIPKSNWSRRVTIFAPLLDFFSLIVLPLYITTL